MCAYPYMIDIELCAQQIYDTIGPCYSERVYHNCFEVLLRKHNVPYETERIIPNDFMGHVVGNLRADIIINNEIVLEFKAIKSLNEQVELQAQNYLRLLNLSKAYLINFPPFPDRSVEIRCIEALP